MKRKLWTLLLALGAALALCAGASATTVDNDFYEALSVTNGSIKLENDFVFENVMDVGFNLTIDLNGHVLTIPKSICVNSRAHLTIIDSNPSAEHKFTPNADGLWVLDETNGTETVYGGVITGGTGYPIQFGSGAHAYTAYYGGAVYIEPGGTLNMGGGSIVGCSAVYGGGVCVEGKFFMTGGSIIGCAADRGGGVYMRDDDTVFNMSGSAAIRYCKAASKDSSHASGGGVFVSGKASLTLKDQAAIKNCSAKKTSDGVTHGGGIFAEGTLTIAGLAEVDKDCSAAVGSGIYMEVGSDFLVSQNLYANGGVIAGEVVLNNSSKHGATLKITGSGKDVTEFKGSVLNNGGIIEKGNFTGKVTNNGTISGGEFSGEVTNNKTISDGTFNGTVINGESGTIAEGVSITALKFVVTFDNEGTRTTAIIDNGGKLTAPAAPTKEGYRFDGWYYVNNGGKAKWNFDTDIVTRAMTLTAKWVQTYTVAFDTNGGSAVAPVTVDAGSTVTKPADPTKSGYTFGGWYMENTYENPYDFHAAVTGSLTLYAKWNAIVYSDPTYAVSAPAAENGSVTVSPKNASAGSTVTITVKPDSGYVLETISATDRNGNDLKLTDRGNGKYTFTMPTSKVEIKVTFMEDNSVLNFFYDVPNGAYYYDAVKWAVDNGITGGVGNSLFAPNQPCTRGQIVTFLWRAAGSPVVNYAMNMTDVAEDAYYGEAVRWALSEGITTGIGDTAFGPDAACTRAQAVAFLFRYAVASGMDAVTLADLISGFADAASVPGYAVSAMNWALSQGIMQGSGTQLLSGNTCTRAQIVTFLYRANQGK